MAGTKKEITQGIVDQIIQEVNHQRDLMQAGYERDVDQEIETYKNEQTLLIEKEIETYRDKRMKEKVKLDSSMKFEVDRKLRLHRIELLESFKQELIEKITQYRNSSKYGEDIRAIIQTHQDIVKDDCLVIVREEDAQFVPTNANVRYESLEMGGIRFEMGNKVLDYTLKTRFEEAIDTFINNSNLEL